MKKMKLFPPSAWLRKDIRREEFYKLCKRTSVKFRRTLLIREENKKKYFTIYDNCLVKGNQPLHKPRIKSIKNKGV